MERDLFTEIDAFLKGGDVPPPAKDPIAPALVPTEAERIRDDDPRLDLADRVLKEIFPVIPDRRISQRFLVHTLIQRFNYAKNQVYNMYAGSNNPNKEGIISMLSELNLQKLAELTIIQKHRFEAEAEMTTFGTISHDIALNQSEFYRVMEEVTAHAAHETRS